MIAAVQSTRKSRATSGHRQRMIGRQIANVVAILTATNTKIDLAIAAQAQHRGEWIHWRLGRTRDIVRAVIEILDAREPAKDLGSIAEAIIAHVNTKAKNPAHVEGLLLGLYLAVDALEALARRTKNQHLVGIHGIVDDLTGDLACNNIPFENDNPHYELTGERRRAAIAR